MHTPSRCRFKARTGLSAAERTGRTLKLDRKTPYAAQCKASSAPVVLFAAVMRQKEMHTCRLPRFIRYQLSHAAGRGSGAKSQCMHEMSCGAEG
jgi:hypothetical protein